MMKCDISILKFQLVRHYVHMAVDDRFFNEMFDEAGAPRQLFADYRQWFGEQVAPKLLKKPARQRNCFATRASLWQSMARRKRKNGLFHLTLCADHRVGFETQIEAENPYCEEISSGWGNALRQALKSLPAYATPLK